MAAPRDWRLAVDIGGTFTDIVAKRPEGGLLTYKLLSENPEQYKDAAVAGIRHLLGLKTGEPVTPDVVECVKMGTTVATNALLERKGEPTLLVTTKGFRDALRIAYQNRPRIFDRHIKLPELLYKAVVEVDERMGARPLGRVIQEHIKKPLADEVRRALAERPDLVVPPLVRLRRRPQDREGRRVRPGRASQAAGRRRAFRPGWQASCMAFSPVRY